MLFHHDHRTYEEAASQAARVARTKLEGLIVRGRHRAAEVIDAVEREVPDDYVVPSPRMHFEPSPSGVVLDFADAHGHQITHGLHRHALHQATDKVRLPRRYADELLDGEEWQRDLLAHSLNELFEHSGKTYLIRSVDEQVRGFLSNRFRRMDSRPIIEAFAGACAQHGAVPVEGHCLQTKVALKALMPVVYEPVPNEVLAVGVVLQNSDFGHGALSLRSFILRLWCTNLAIADEMLRQVHLGRRLDENVEFSQKTYQLDTATVVSATEDIVASAFAPDTIEKLLEGMRRAHEEQISPTQISAFLRKTVNKAEAKQITDAFASADVLNLPQGQTRYRLSNAVSWIAGKTEDEGRRLELETVAGSLLKAA